MPRVKGKPPATTKSGLVHLHALIGPAVYRAVKARATHEGTTVSAIVHEMLADATGRAIPTWAGAYQADR